MTKHNLERGDHKEETHEASLTDPLHKESSETHRLHKNGATIVEDGAGRVTSIHTKTGSVFKFEYETQGDKSVIAAVVEPDGAILKRVKDGEWERQKANSSEPPTSFHGEISVSRKGSIAYIGKGGQDTIFNGNGSVVETEIVDGDYDRKNDQVTMGKHGKRLITKVSDGKGDHTEISYDAQGNPFSLYNYHHPESKGAWLVQPTSSTSEKPQWDVSTGNSATGDKSVPWKVSKHADGSVLVDKGGGVTVQYSLNGITKSKD